MLMIDFSIFEAVFLFLPLSSATLCLNQAS